MDAEFLQEMIDATKAQIRALNTAILALSSGTQESYTLDTGQTRQTVTKKNLGGLQKDLDALMNRLATMCARQSGSGVTMRPGW